MGEGAPAPAVSAPHRVGPAGSSRAREVFAEQVRHLYRFSVVSCAGALLGAVVAASALWHVLPPLPLALWAACAAIVTALRYALYRAFLRLDPTAHEARRWCTYLLIATVADGVLWGALGSVLLPAHSMPHELLVLLILAALLVTSAVVLAPVAYAGLAFLIPAALPAIATLLAQRSAVHFDIGLLLLAFAVLVGALGRMLSRTLEDGIAIRIEHGELLARLSQTHAAARRTNLELNEQVQSQRRTAEQLKAASQKLGAMIEVSPLAIVALDAQGRVETWNAAAERMLGWREDEVRGERPPYRLPGGEAGCDAFHREMLSGGLASGVETVLLRRDGTGVEVSFSAARMEDGEGRLAGYVTMIADITERNRVQRRCEVTARIGAALSEADSVEAAMPYVLQTLCESYRFAYGARWKLEEERLSCAETWALPLASIDQFVERSLEAPIPKDDGLLGRVRASGSPLWISDIGQEGGLGRREEALDAGLRAAFAFPLSTGGEFHGLMEFFAHEPRPTDEDAMQVARDVGPHIAASIARRQAERSLQLVASRDELTGLYNRSMFIQRLHEALAQAQRHERRLAVLFLDLDGFKRINDTLGHDAGDVLLGELAARMRACMREGDTIGRLGGDEFVVLIEGYREDAQLLEVARKVLETVAQPYTLREGSYCVTASIGIAAFPEDGREAAELVTNADSAMYRAKQQGKNNFRFHSPEMNTHLVDRGTLESALRRALEHGEFTLYYQPRVSLRDNRVSGVEALLRWAHPTHGVLNPPQFVPLAEEAGLFAAIGDWTLHAACRQLRAWHQRGAAHLRVAVNLSARQFSQPNLMERLRDAVHSAGIKPKQLEIEVTEGVLMRHAERAARLLAQMKDLGAQVVLDDFGTGYASLGCLRRFPIDAVKIDRSLVAQLPHGVETAALTRAVIAMAHSLGLHVMAEGVETRAQWDFLSGSGCDSIQGNFFCAPAPEEALGPIVLPQPHGAVRVASVEPIRPWRAAHAGVEADLCYTAPESPGGVR